MMHSGFENTSIDIFRIFNYKTYLGIKPALFTKRCRETVKMSVPPGNRRGLDPRRTWIVRRRIRGPRTPGRTTISAVAVGGSWLMRARNWRAVRWVL